MEKITLKKCKSIFAHYNTAYNNLNTTGIHTINVSKAYTREYMVYFIIDNWEVDSVHCYNQSQLRKALNILNKRIWTDAYEIYKYGWKRLVDIVTGNLKTLKKEYMAQVIA